jgi:hypothetical protein
MNVPRERRLGDVKSAARKPAAQLILAWNRSLVKHIPNRRMPLLLHSSNLVRFSSLCN